MIVVAERVCASLDQLELVVVVDIVVHCILVGARHNHNTEKPVATFFKICATQLVRDLIGTVQLHCVPGRAQIVISLHVSRLNAMFDVFGIVCETKEDFQFLMSSKDSPGKR